MNLVFESDRWVCVDKPTGTLSVPSRMGEEDGRPVVGRALEARLGVRLWPVHRLDFEVSGLLLFAKDAEAHRLGNRWFEAHQVQKTYEGWTAERRTTPSDGTLTWSSRLLRGKKRAYEHQAGKESITRARWLGSLAWRGTSFDRWSLEPLTGRSHQLRYEMAKHAGPLAGDSLYGAQTTWTPGGIALRAVRINFPEGERFDLPSQLELSEGLQGILECQSGEKIHAVDPRSRSK